MTLIEYRHIEKCMKPSSSLLALIMQNVHLHRIQQIQLPLRLVARLETAPGCRLIIVGLDNDYFDELANGDPSTYKQSKNFD